MLCIYVERCFESLICWLDLCLSSLPVTFISLCFSFLRKLLFFKLHGSSIDPRHISFYRALHSPFLDRSWWILNPSSFLGFFSIASSIHRDIFLSSLSDRFSTNSRSIKVILPSTTPWQIHFCWDLVLDRSLQIFQSIELRFPYIGWAQIKSYFSLRSLSTEFLFSHPKHFSFTQISSPSPISALIKP